MERVTAKKVHSMLRQYLQSRSDLGLWKAISVKILQPQSPFGPGSARKPQRWFVLLLTITMALIGAFVYFNFSN
jgi:hypothetical protein